MTQFIGYRAPTDIEWAFLEKMGFKISGNSLSGYYLQVSKNIFYNTDTNTFQWHKQHIVEITESGRNISFKIDSAALSKALVINRYREFEKKIQEYQKEREFFWIDYGRTQSGIDTSDTIEQALNSANSKILDIIREMKKSAQNVIDKYIKIITSKEINYKKFSRNTETGSYEVKKGQLQIIKFKKFYINADEILKSEGMDKDNFPVPPEMLDAITGAIKVVIQKRIKELKGDWDFFKDQTKTDSKIKELKEFIEDISKTDIKYKDLKPKLDILKHSLLITQQRSYWSLFKTEQSTTEKMLKDIERVVHGPKTK